MRVKGLRAVSLCIYRNRDLGLYQERRRERTFQHGQRLSPMEKREVVRNPDLLKQNKESHGMFDFISFLVLGGLIGPHTYALKSLVKEDHLK